MTATTELWPYQKAELRGGIALLYWQLHTGESIGNEILVEGRAGTGKSIGILTFLVQACYSWPGIRVLLVRDTRTSLTESAMATLESEVLGADHPSVVNGPTREHRTHYDIGGSKLVCGSLDKPERLYSTNWDFIYLNEGIECSEEAWQLFGRSQRPRIGAARDAAPFRQRIVDVNPGPPGHWLNQRAFRCSDSLRGVSSVADYQQLQRYNAGPQDAKMRRIVTVHQDNPNYWDMDVWGWSVNGLEMLPGLEAMSGHNRARMLEGRWVAAAGSVYPEFDESRHVIPAFDIPSDWPWVVWWDPGYQHPTAIIWAAIAPSGRIYFADEIVQAGRSVEQHCETFAKRAAGRNIQRVYGDPHHAFSQTAQSPVTIAQQAEKCGVKMIPGPSCRNSVEIEAQANMVRTGLTEVMADKKPRIMVFDRCQRTIWGFQTWSYKRNADGSIPSGDDRFEDIDDDEMDCVRGIIASRPSFSRPRASVVYA